MEINKKRANNENLGVEFSLITWSELAEAVTGAESTAMIKIAELYWLGISDLDISKIQKLDGNDSSPKCSPSN